MNIKEKLSLYSQTLISSTDHGEIRTVLHETHALCSYSNNVFAGDINDSDIYLPSGKAISPTKAAH